MNNTEALAKLLDDAIGENDGAQRVDKWIDTGYEPLNEIISGSPNGGLPFGRLVEMFGESSTGKTALATLWMVQAQKMGGVAGFSDWERSFDVGLAEGFGLNTVRPHWIYARPKTWEEGNMIAARACQVIRDSKAISPDAPILWVFDSIASAVPKSQLEKNIDELTMNDTTALARVTSTTLKVQAQIAAEYNATFLYLNQIRLKPGVVYGDPRTTPGGKAMEYYASTRLSLGRSKIMEKIDGENEFVGQIINIQCTKSKFTRPFQSTEVRMTFDECGAANFDFVGSLVDYAIAEGKLKFSRPRVEWVDGKLYFRKALVEKIKEEGSIEVLKALFR